MHSTAYYVLEFNVCMLPQSSSEDAVDQSITVRKDAKADPDFLRFAAVPVFCHLVHCLGV